MSTQYPSNLTREQFAVIEPMLSKAKSGGHKREVDLFEIINTILYVLVEGCRWRALSATFPKWQTAKPV